MRKLPQLKRQQPKRLPQPRLPPLRKTPRNKRLPTPKNRSKQMKLPLSWLNEFVKIDDIEPRELAEKLTRAGLQVESIESVGGEELSDLIVVAEVLECEKHPDSDHLHVCKVTDGKETFQVVCGAPNMRKGIKTAFAKIGALIPDGGFKIKKGKLRGVESFGMCCSEHELKIGAGADGIIEYPAETPVGALVRDVAKLEKPEIVFDIEVTWNRPDALSVVGLAREFAAILHRPLAMPDVSFVESLTEFVKPCRKWTFCRMISRRFEKRFPTQKSGRISR